MRIRFFIRLFAFSIAAASLFPVGASGQTNQAIYSDTLQNGWADWSWASVDLANTNPVHNGVHSISVTAKAWQGLYFSHPPFDSSRFSSLRFWINGGERGGQLIRVCAFFHNKTVSDSFELPPLPKSAWRETLILLPGFIAPGQPQIDGFQIQDGSGNAQRAFYVDDVELLAGPSPAPATNREVAVAVDAAADRHPISPEIYGVAFASSNQLRDLNVPLNRWGGNSTTRYNWKLNADNRGADWFFESIAAEDPTPGGQVDDFIAQGKAAGAESLVTIPMIGWGARLGPHRSTLPSYSIAKYGPQTARDSGFPDAGNGISSPSGRPITSNDPNDANLRADVHYQAGWISHLTNRWGTAAGGGVHYYLLDNEPSLWHKTHRDVQPVGATMRGVLDKAVSTARMIKQTDPAALVCGPEEWGWTGYFYSGYDQQWLYQHAAAQPPDRETNGGWDYLPWFLDQMRRQSDSAGRRLLDVFTVHYYPQGGEMEDGVSPALQQLRNRSTRSLWDPGYIDQSWIQKPVLLIPRLKAWVATNYPGTRVGITEYCWGADNHINGATAQADILGIFGREGLDLATRWTVPETGTPVYNAIKLYRNYDGRKSGFGDLSVSARAPDPDTLAVFAAVRSGDGALTIMVVNKVFSGTTPLRLNLSNFSGGGKAEAWQLTFRNSITRLADVSVRSGALESALPAQSITLFVLPRGGK